MTRTIAWVTTEFCLLMFVVEHGQQPARCQVSTLAIEGLPKVALG